jgi:hypothetical protein
MDAGPRRTCWDDRGYCLDSDTDLSLDVGFLAAGESHVYQHVARILDSVGHVAQESARRPAITNPVIEGQS